MEGYDVVTVDDEKAGRVVGTQGEYLVVEHGTIFKARHAIPRELTHVHEAEGIVRLNVSKEILDGSPKVSDDFDQRLVAEYYGLGAGYEAPPTAADEDDLGAEGEGARDGVDSPVEERLRVHDSLGSAREDPAREGLPGAQIRPTSGTD